MLPHAASRLAACRRRRLKKSVHCAHHLVNLMVKLLLLQLSGCLTLSSSIHFAPFLAKPCRHRPREPLSFELRGHPRRLFAQTAEAAATFSMTSCLDFLVQHPRLRRPLTPATQRRRTLSVYTVRCRLIAHAGKAFAHCMPICNNAHCMPRIGGTHCAAVWKSGTVLPRTGVGKAGFAALTPPSPLRRKRWRNAGEETSRRVCELAVMAKGLGCEREVEDMTSGPQRQICGSRNASGSLANAGADGVTGAAGFGVGMILGGLEAGGRGTRCADDTVCSR